MSLTRRYFLQSSAALSAAAMVRGHVFADDAKPQSKSPNEKIGLAVIGTGSRGADHIVGYAGRSDAEILYLCDVDTSANGGKVKGVTEKQGRAPTLLQDFRKALDDPKVDAISTATPNHWHSLVAIWAMQAGKHVYVEKPVSHNVFEGRQAVKWARHLGRICQTGTQSRSSPSLKAAVEWVRKGEVLGPVQYAIGTCYKARMSIGKLTEPLKIPDNLDYDMWCGPAAKVDLFRPKLHYDWHWDWNTGNGDMGNQGIHQMDISRWFLGEMTLSPKVMSIGGRVGYEDAGNTPNTQIVWHGFEKAPLIFETRGLPSAKEHMERWGNDQMDVHRGSRVGVIVQCEKGYVVIPSYTGAQAFYNDGSPVEGAKWSGGSDHYDNFLYACRSGKHEDLNADILEGHLSSALCHTGGISHQLGQKASAADIAASVKGNDLWADSYARMAEHLARLDVNIESPTLALGPVLEMDVEKEQFTNSDAANKLLTRPYRPGYVVPECPA